MAPNAGRHACKGSGWKNHADGGRRGDLAALPATGRKPNISRCCRTGCTRMQRARAAHQGAPDGSHGLAHGRGGVVLVAVKLGDELGDVGRHLLARLPCDGRNPACMGQAAHIMTPPNGRRTGEGSLWFGRRRGQAPLHGHASSIGELLRQHDQGHGWCPQQVAHTRRDEGVSANMRRTQRRRRGWTRARRRGWPGP